MYPYLGNTNIVLYDLLGFLSFIPLFVFNFLQFNKECEFSSPIRSLVLKYGNKKSTKFNFTLTVLVEILLISLFQYGFTPVINFKFGTLFDTGANYYGLLYINPILVALACCLLGINYIKQFDLFAPAFPLALMVIKLSCFCCGCCYGVECSWGLYNKNTELVEFPVQLLELFSAFIIFIILIIYRKKAKEGTVFPVYLIIYSTFRFFSEFLRGETNVLWIFKKYHFFCLSGIVIGFLELLIAIKYSDKIVKLYEKIAVFIENHLYRFALKYGIIKENEIVHQKKGTRN